jgi:predicted  nucleic acid-binding Zn-ribbon protein
MLTQAERAAEKRRAKLEEMKRQVKDGSLKIRKMTAQERKRFPPQPAKAQRAKAPRR